MHDTDTIIVGAGPIGIELAAALKGIGHDYLHLEAAQIGHTVSWYAPGTHFFSSPERIAIAGVPLTTANQDKATREEYLAYLRAVVAQFDLPIRTYEPVESITPSEPRPGETTRFTVRTRPRGSPTHNTCTARTVVLAIGDMHRPRRLNIPGEDLPHVSHYFGDPHDYFRRRVLLIGGRNSVVEAAIRLHRLGADAAISYRQDRFDPERIKYWLYPEINWLIDKRKVGFHPRTRPLEITPGAVTLESLDTGERTDVPADTVLLLTGYEQDPTLFESLGIHLAGPERAPRHNHVTMETNVRGIYVAGTATAGTQTRFKSFIETSHVHVPRIVRAITGRPPSPDIALAIDHAAEPRYANPES